METQAGQAGQLSLLDVDTSRKLDTTERARRTRRQGATHRDTRVAGDPATASAALLTTAEAAKRLHVHPRTVQRLVERGQLVAVHLGGAVRYDPDDLDGLIADNKQRHESSTPLHLERPKRGRGERVSFAERVRSDKDEHRATDA
jgi:excisionase family DNA binding protein